MNSLAKIVVPTLLLMLFASSAYSCVTEELIQLENLNPIEEAKSEFSKGNKKFLGVYQFSLEVPAVSGDPYCWLNAGFVNVIQGTGDKICSKEHGRLQRIANNYALKYNKELLKLMKYYEQHKCRITYQEN